jgi:serine protease
MKLRGLVTSIAMSALLLSGIAPAAGVTVRTSNEKISGDLVQYAEGVKPFAPKSGPTLANLPKGQVLSENLGNYSFAWELESPLRSTQEKIRTHELLLDSRVAKTESEFQIVGASANPISFKSPAVSRARPASAPRSLSARSAVTASSPSKARVRLNWLAPANRFGASVVGYSIQYSSNGGASWRTLIQDTGDNQTRAFVSDGIRAGINYRFRVRAITNDGSDSNTIGSSSSAVAVSVRTAPKQVFITSGVRVGPGNVTFLEQSASDRGGFSAAQVRYLAVATAPGLQSVETSFCNATRCRFPDLVANTSYTVEVFAANELGTSNSNDAVSVSDTYFPMQWYLNGQFGISMTKAWGYSKGDGYKVVAVVDSGVNQHPDLDLRLTRNIDGSIYGYDFVSSSEFSGDGDGRDDNPTDDGSSAGNGSYHGTQVAGVIAAELNGTGTVGVAPNVKILPVRALGAGQGSPEDVMDAIRWASGELVEGTPKNRFPASVINLSLGTLNDLSCQKYETDFLRITSRGVSIVVAAGNQARGSLSFPANCPGVIAVVASNSLGDRASYSNFGPGSLISAPGGDFSVGSVEAPSSQGGVATTWIDAAGASAYTSTQGTSMAAPIVSGLVAIMYSMQPSISSSKVRKILRESVRPFADGSLCLTSTNCGSGILDAHLVLAKMSALR